MPAASAETIATDPLAQCTPLPDRLSPVFAKELRQGLRAHRFVLPFVALQVFAVIAIAAELVLSSSFHGPSGSGFFGGLFIGVLIVGVGVVMPLTSIAALRPELSDGRNVELLLMSNLDRWQIVRGKWLVAFTLSMLMLVSLLPYMLTRYFAGGTELIIDFLIVAGVIIGNALLTGIAIGASGFGNLLGRIFLFGMGALSAWGTIMGASFRFMMPGPLSGTAVGSSIVAILVSALVAALYVVYGLQLGRSRLRLFENPLDPPASGLVIALMIFTPIVVGVASAATLGYAGWVAVGGLLALALSIDRGPGRKAKAVARYLQP
jgi:hypothetical protein